MDHVITRIAKLSVTAAALLIGQSDNAHSAESRPANQSIMRRIPPVETMRRIPPVDDVGSQEASEPFDSKPTPAMRRLPDVAFEEPAPATTSASTTAEFRRLPQVEDASDGSSAGRQGAVDQRSGYSKRPG